MKLLKKWICKRGYGRLVINQGKTPAQASTYYFIPTHLEGEGDADLLFTEAEVKRAKIRAENQPEDCR